MRDPDQGWQGLAAFPEEGRLPMGAWALREGGSEREPTELPPRPCVLRHRKRAIDRAVRISFDPQTISTDLYKILLDQRPKVANPLIIDLEAAKASTVVNKNLSVNRSKFGMVTCNTPTLQADFARQVPPEAQRVVDKVLCFVRRVSFMSPAHPDRAHRSAAGRGMIAPGWGATDPEPARPGGDPAECAAIDEGLTRRGDTNSSNSLFRSRN